MTAKEKIERHLIWVGKDIFQKLLAEATYIQNREKRIFTVTELLRQILNKRYGLGDHKDIDIKGL